MAGTELDICNRAIAKISGDPIDQLDEDSPLGVFCAQNYAPFRRMVLGKYRWSFARRDVLLTQVGVPDGVEKPLAFLFQRPADLIGAVHAWRDQPDPQRGQPLYVVETVDGFWCDQSRVYAECTVAVAEDRWPGWFENLMVVAFAAELALHAQNGRLAESLTTQAWGVRSENGEGGLYAQARNEDARMAPQRALTTAGVSPGPLVAVRAGGPGWGWDGSFIDPPGS